MDIPHGSDQDSRQSLLHGPASAFNSLFSRRNGHLCSREKQDSEEGQDLKPAEAVHSNRFFRLWRWEVLSMIASIGALIAIAAILWAYNNKPMSAWHAFLRPNTVISALSTLSKSAMLMVIGQGIGQLKWVYFEQRPHRLADFETFDAASRGPLGAIQILYEINGRAFVASVGATITVLALAMDPFVQQVISFETRPRDNLEVRSSIFNARAYDHDTFGSPQRSYASYPILDAATYAEITGAIYSGIFTKELNSTIFECSSGNCHWDTYEALGICSTCTDVTDQTTTTTEKYESGATMRTLWKSTFNQTFVTDGSDSRKNGHIGALSTLKIAQGSRYGDCSDPLQQVLDCRVSWCAKTYATTEVDNGRLRDVPTTHEALTFMDQIIPTENITKNNFTNTGLWMWEFYYDVDWAAPPGCSFGCGLRLPAFKSSKPPDVSHLTGLYKLADFVDNRDAFWVGWMDDYNIRTALSNALTSFALSGISESPSNDSDVRAQQFHQSSDFLALLDRITESLTLAFRQGPNSTVFHGSTTFAEQYIVVHWPWMALPASLVSIAILFLAASMMFAVEKSGAVWKSSTIPMLFHGLSGWDPAQLQDVQLQAMERRARGMRASLREDGNERLVLMRGDWVERL